MPTSADPNLLDRQSSVDRSRQAAPNAAPLLREVVNYGTRVLAECTSLSRPGDKTAAAPLGLYHQVLELTDAVEVLLSSCCPEPSKLLLRSSFEALLSLQYIVEAEDATVFAQRSMAWLAGSLNGRLRALEAFVPTSRQGKRFLESAANDEHVKDFPVPPPQLVQDQISSINQYLASDDLRDIVLEISKLKPLQPWYMAFKGPVSVRDLATQLRRPLQYDILYGQWSAYAHGADISAFEPEGSAGPAGMRKLRETDQIGLAATFACNFLLYATYLLTGRFGLQKDYAAWYVSEVAEDFLALAQHPRPPWKQQ